jgi:hypothetical protein
MNIFGRRGGWPMRRRLSGVVSRESTPASDLHFSLVNAMTLDYCYVQHQDGYRATCARLKKQGAT